MLLQVQFEYPDILRQPTADVLTKFQAGGPRLVAIWYALTLTAVLFIPVVVLVHRIMATAETSATLWVATVFGVVAGVVQALGFLRWPFLVPHTRFPSACINPPVAATSSAARPGRPGSPPQGRHHMYAPHYERSPGQPRVARPA